MATFKKSMVTLLVFQLAMFALILTAICTKNWLAYNFDEGSTRIGLFGYCKYIATTLDATKTEWTEVCGDVKEIQGVCLFRKDGFRVTAGFMFTSLTMGVVALAVLAYNWTRNPMEQKKSLIEAVGYLNAVSAVFLTLSICIFAATAEMKCLGEKLRKKDVLFYGYSYGMAVAVCLVMLVSSVTLIRFPSKFVISPWGKTLNNNDSADEMGNNNNTNDTDDDGQIAY